nr:uncharacterized protein CI109_007182 [Kwoniella shandongensis]KAA5524475.1 hypothetical protein CI109_007182 [Kwoniella shandongensis]
MDSTEDDRRNSMSAQDDNHDAVVGRKRRRRVDHITKACDSCRIKKTRCDGALPTCGPCSNKGLDCTHEKEDGRKKRGDSGSLREKLDNLMSLLRAAQSTPNVTVPVISPEPSSNTSTLDPVIALASISPPYAPTLSGGEDQQNILPDTTSHSDDLFAGFHITPTADSAKSDASTSPYTTTEPGSIHPAVSSNDRLKRAGTSSHMQYGPTSFWSYAPDASQGNIVPQNHNVDLRPGEWVHWAQHLPPGLNITKKVHDAALSLFGAYYAHWCMAVDMPAFLRDLEACNLVSTVMSSKSPTRRTSSYSPLLHNCALHLGLHFNRDVWPDLATNMGSMLLQHCASMVINETEDPDLSTPRALALYAACLNLRTDKSAHNIGYIHFGMAFACVQGLGVNLKCDHLVDAGQITSDDRAARSAGYWTLFQQDLVVDIALSTESDDVNRDQRVARLLNELETWYRDQPFSQPQSYPVPHLLVMHMLYHLTVIYLLRPYFRASLDITPPAAQRCEQAADAISELLTVFDATHGLRNGVASIIPVIFANATIRLLVLVSNTTWSDSYNHNLKSLDECVHFMDTIAFTWMEARRAYEIIRFLRGEWLPFSPSTAEDASTSQVNMGVGNTGEVWASDEVVGMLQEWGLRDGMYGMSTLGLQQTFDLRL